jgi:surface antigen
MRLTGFTAALCGSAFAFSMTCIASSQARPRHIHQAPHHASSHHLSRYAVTSAHRAHVIQCVAFAKSDAGIDISGNARDWWTNAAGIYERGARPEPGSVLSFQANGRMPLGHVAVVSAVADSRTILIDQSHWGRNGISRDMIVKDVSEDNDWTAVRVQLAHRDEFGSIYPTHGFIYPRPDRGVMVANDGQSPVPALDPAPADLRRHGRVTGQSAVEVAEAPASGPIDLSTPGVAAGGMAAGGIAAEAPSRGLR